jgi:hypothetical protein
MRWTASAMRVARGLPAQELDRALRGEELEHDREVVLHELVVEDGGALRPPDRHRLVAGQLCQEARASERERVRGRAGTATHHADLPITDEAVEHRNEVGHLAADEGRDLGRCEELVLGERAEELREPWRLGSEKGCLCHRSGRGS